MLIKSTRSLGSSAPRRTIPRGFSLFLSSCRPPSIFFLENRCYSHAAAWSLRIALTNAYETSIASHYSPACSPSALDETRNEPTGEVETVARCSAILCEIFCWLRMMFLFYILEILWILCMSNYLLSSKSLQIFIDSDYLFSMILIAMFFFSYWQHFD